MFSIKIVIFPSRRSSSLSNSTGKVTLTVFWDMQGSITILFLEKQITVNNANDCKLLRQVKKDVKNVFSQSE